MDRAGYLPIGRERLECERWSRHRFPRRLAAAACHVEKDFFEIVAAVTRQQSRRRIVIHDHAALHRFGLDALRHPQADPIPGIIPHGSLCIFSGASAVGKTILKSQWCYALVHGEPILEPTSTCEYVEVTGPPEISLAGSIS